MVYKYMHAVRVPVLKFHNPTEWKIQNLWQKKNREIPLGYNSCFSCIFGTMIEKSRIKHELLNFMCSSFILTTTTNCATTVLACEWDVKCHLLLKPTLPREKQPMIKMFVRSFRTTTTIEGSSSGWRDWFSFSSCFNCKIRVSYANTQVISYFFQFHCCVACLW